MRYITLIPLLSLLFIPVFAEKYEEPQKGECVFTSHLEKSFIYFQERPWVLGYVSNCDDGIENHKKDFVYMRILDVNGDLLDDKWIPEARHTVKGDQPPQKYVFNDSVYRGGGLGGNADVSGKDVVHISPDHYFFYMPQIHSIDFEHMGVYQLELTYGNYTNIIPFAVLDPNCWWKNIIEPNSCKTLADQ